MDKLNAELKQHNAMDLLEEDLSRKLLAKMRYFKHFEEDGTLDWFFHLISAGLKPWMTIIV